MRRIVIFGAATIALLGLILALSPRQTSEETVALPDDPEVLLALGLAQRHTGDYRGAEVSLRKALEVSPARSARRQQIQCELGLALLKQKRPREALVELARSLLENPYSRRAYVQLGQCLSRLARLEAADACFEIARSLSRGDAESRRAADFLAAGRPVLAARYRARSFSLRGQFGEAERVLREATSNGSPGVHVYLVEYLMDTLQVQEARRALEELALLLGRSHPDVRGWMAMALKQEGRAEEAAAIISELCRELPRLIEVWAPEIARILLEDLAKPRAALQWLELYLERRDNVEARILLARSHFGVGELEEAVEVLEATPSGGFAWRQGAGDVWLALCRVRLGQDLEMVGKVLTSIADSEHLPEYQLAMAEWRIATHADSDGSVGRGQRAHRLAVSRAEFRTLCHRAALAAGPEIASHLCSAAEVLLAMGDRERAIRFARIAASAAPREPRAWTLLEKWLQRPEEVFFRAEAQRKLTALGETGISSSLLAEIVESLTGRER